MNLKILTRVLIGREIISFTTTCRVPFSKSFLVAVQSVGGILLVVGGPPHFGSILDVVFQKLRLQVIWRLKGFIASAFYCPHSICPPVSNPPGPSTMLVSFWQAVVKNCVISPLHFSSIFDVVFQGSRLRAILGLRGPLLRQFYSTHSILPPVSNPPCPSNNVVFFLAGGFEKLWHSPPP